MEVQFYHPLGIWKWHLEIETRVEIPTGKPILSQIVIKLKFSQQIWLQRKRERPARKANCVHPLRTMPDSTQVLRTAERVSCMKLNHRDVSLLDRLLVLPTVGDF